MHSNQGEAGNRGRGWIDAAVTPRRASRRRLLRAALGALGGAPIVARVGGAETAGTLDQDVAIDDGTAFLFSEEAPLVPAAGLRDARGVWAGVPRRPDGSVLVFLHGHNGYVTVDAKGRSRVPDWAAGETRAREGVAVRPAAPLAYGLDRLESRRTGKAPIVLVPEDSTLATGAFWAKEPAGQYVDPSRLGTLVSDCVQRLARLRRPGGGRYLSDSFVKIYLRPEARLARLCLCGHSGAGLPLEEAARSALVAPDAGNAADLWLFDCTYWSNVAGFAQFCKRWHAAGRLAAGREDSARLVCIYRSKTQTESVADALRAEAAKILAVDAAALVTDHTPDNLETALRPALRRSGVLFVRTHVRHDIIPTEFIPLLLETAAIRASS